MLMWTATIVESGRTTNMMAGSEALKAASHVAAGRSPSRRKDFLVEQGFATRSGDTVIARRDLLTALRQQDLEELPKL